MARLDTIKTPSVRSGLDGKKPLVGCERKMQDRFRLEKFLESSDVDRLCWSLSELLIDRIRTCGSDQWETSRQIVNELKEAGHELFSWDESCDYSVWGGNYQNPQSPNRMLLSFQFGTEPTVEVEFGPWPISKPQPGPSCPTCQGKMKPSVVVDLELVGHGSAIAPFVSAKLVVGTISLECVAGARTVRRHIEGFICSSCGGVFVPSQ